MEKEKLENRKWKISKANKKNSGKRFKRQFLIFLLSISIILIAILVCICIYNKKECELWYVPETIEDLELKDELFEEDDYNEEIYDDEINSSSEFKNVYSIEGKDFNLYEHRIGFDEEYEGVKLLEYDNSHEDYALIYYVFYDYTTDPSYYYTLEITDTDLNSLLLDENNQSIKEENIIGGVISNVRIKKNNLNSKIIVSVSERMEDKTSYKKEAKTEIDLSEDLVSKEKLVQSDIVQGRLADVSFSYIYDEYVYFGETSHAYSDNLIGENFSVNLKAQFGNRLLRYSYIDLYDEKNVNNLTLSQAFEDFKLISENMGQYGLSDVYGLELENQNSEVTETILVNFEEMKNLAKGQTINKNGKNYSKNDFLTWAGISFNKQGEEVIGNGIETIKYTTLGEPDAEYYMFIYKENIYELKVPTDDRVKDEVQNFLNSLELD